MGHLPTCEDTFGCHNLGKVVLVFTTGGDRFLIASSELYLGILLNILQPQDSLLNKELFIPNVNSVKIETLSFNCM